MQREDGSWLVDGAMPIDEFKRRFETGLLPREASETFETLGGFMVDRFGHIPSSGENFTSNSWRFEIVDMDRHRVDKVLLTRASPPPPAAPSEARGSR